MYYVSYLKKLKVENLKNVNYYLETENSFIHFNNLIGKKISISYLGEIKCFCEKRVTVTFRQNFCYDCFYKLPQAGESVFYPERSKAHLNIEDRDLEWEKENQLQPHIVYLAISGETKVGVTRKNQKYIRWIDQGADYAMVLADTPNRYLAGVMESEIKKHISDKTNWHKMLKNDKSLNPSKLLDIKKDILNFIPEDLKKYILKEEVIEEIVYPHNNILQKVKNLDLKEKVKIDGNLTGIKGQYLIFDNLYVLNIRKNEGSKVLIEINL